ASDQARSSAARRSGGVARQAGKAAAAAATASSTSSAPEAGTRAHTSPVAGSVLSIQRAERAGRNSPPMWLRYSVVIDGPPGVGAGPARCGRNRRWGAVLKGALTPVCADQTLRYQARARFSRVRRGPRAQYPLRTERP